MNHNLKGGLSKGDQVEDADDEDGCFELQTANSVQPPDCHPCFLKNQQPYFQSDYLFIYSLYLDLHQESTYIYIFKSYV